MFTGSVEAMHREKRLDYRVRSTFWLFASLAILVLLLMPGTASGGVDGDGNLDAIFSNALEPNQACFGDGSGGFSCSNLSADSFDTHGVAAGDVDADGNVDVVFANSFQPNRVCLGDGAGGFTCSDLSTDADGAFGVALADVDGNGNVDAVFANSFQPNRVCLGDGAGGFTCSDVSIDVDNTHGVALGDADGDGDLDAVFANLADPMDPSSGRNRVCLGDGSGGFVCSDVSADSFNTGSVAMGHVNEDGNLDAVFANGGQPNQLCLGDGAGVFACTDVSADTGATTGVALAVPGGDSDGDGVADPNDLCPGTVIPESVPFVRLGVNRYALVDDDGVFDTSEASGGGHGPEATFTIEDTAGCSAEQIIEEAGLGQGNLDFGLSFGGIRDWISEVAE